jgi:Na+/H+-dicarboxylate symporter
MLAMAIAPSVDLLVYFFLLVIDYSFKRSPMGTCATRDSNTIASVDTTSYFSANPVIMENIHKNLACEICSQRFNHHERCPMMLCPNQHNACKQCLDRLKQN